MDCKVTELDSPNSEAHSCVFTSTKPVASSADDGAILVLFGLGPDGSLVSGS